MIFRLKGMGMSDLELKPFASAWTGLTTKQRNWLLSQLETFVLQNSKKPGNSKLGVGSAPLGHRKQISVVSAIRKKQKQRPGQAPVNGVVLRNDDMSVFHSTVVKHHSPAKVGRDGVAMYGKTICSQSVINTLLKKGFPKRDWR